jgi:TatD DNase family protein
MHCFTGSYNFSQKLLKLGAFFSASGIITFKKSQDLQKTFTSIPLDKLLIETDSPYLSPVPMRGKKNEPSYIKHTAKKLCELKDTSLENLINSTSKNFNSLFFKN